MDIEQSFQTTIDRIFGFLPNLVGFLIILLIGWIVAKVVAAVVQKLLSKLGLDARLAASNVGRQIDHVLPGASVSVFLAKLVFWFIFIIFLVAAVDALDVPAVSQFMNNVLEFLPNVIVAVLIFVVAALVSSAVGGLISRVLGTSPMGRIASSVVPALIMVIAFFMILEQLQIAPEIVRIAFSAVMFALALGLALAFGLGGKDTAAELLREARSRAGSPTTPTTPTGTTTGTSYTESPAGTPYNAPEDTPRL